MKPGCIIILNPGKVTEVRYTVVSVVQDTVTATHPRRGTITLSLRTLKEGIKNKTIRI